MHVCMSVRVCLHACRPAHLAVQPFDLLLAASGLAVSGAVYGGQQQLGIHQQSVGPLQVSPQPLLHVKVPVTHLPEHTEGINTSGQGKKSPARKYPFTPPSPLPPGVWESIHLLT